MAQNVLITKADSNVPQPGESIPEDIQRLIDDVLAADNWDELKKIQVDWNVRNAVIKSLNASGENQEVSQSIKAIAQVKERVLKIESYKESLPTKEGVDNSERELDDIHAEVLELRIEALDEMLSSQNATGYLQQRADIAETLMNLASIIDSKRNQLREANRLSIFGTKADKMGVMISSLLEVVDVTSTPTDSNLAALPKLELQSRLIDLETKYQYYEPKISRELENIRIMAGAINDDWRVENQLDTLTEQWAELKALANTKKDELKRLLSSARPASKQSIVSPNGSPSRSSVSSYRRAGSRLASPSSTPKQTLSPTPGASGTPPSPTPGASGTPPHSVNNYVPDPNDQLDVEVARIVNACSVKIKVSMVEKESGKYMFGEVKPILCYCRILRSRMVMVRVDGGWVELSKFLVSTSM